MQPQHLPLALLRSTRFFHTSGISQAISASSCDTVFAAIEGAKAAGARFIYDANVRPLLWPPARARAVIAATLAMSDLFLLSLEDGQLLTGTTDIEQIIDWAHTCGARSVVLKLGAEGALSSDGVRREHVAGHRVQCVDATGAGDCFAGAMMARLAQSDELPVALRYANAAAALATTGFGAVGPLPGPEVVQSLLETAY
jgi:2-dehydro-3-deoxygluconokinase